MNLLDLHIIINYPLSCLNRDENGSPKTVRFGGTSRARISSQCFKRAVREYLKSIDKEHFGGVRLRTLATVLESRLSSEGVPQELSQKLAVTVADHLGTMEKEKTKTILFLSEGEIDAIAKSVSEAYKNDKLKDYFKESNDKKTKEVTYKCNKGKLLKNATPVDVADIELFGRMIASDHFFAVEGAASFSHFISVHTCENEVDFFSAVDESADKVDQGAGHIGEIEYNSACYYGCVSINLDLINSGRLGKLPVEVRRDILRAVVDACLIATPKARHNSMFAATKPAAVLGLVREKSFAVSLANAFEQPVMPSSTGYSAAARDRLSEAWKSMKEIYGTRLGVKTELWFPEMNLDSFGEGLTKDVC